MRITLAWFVALVMLAGCATRGAESGPRRDRDVITAEEIEEINVATAFDVIRQLRPEYLRSRGQMSLRDSEPEYAVVYLNGVKYGGLEQLRTIRAMDIAEIRYIGASDATTRWGTGHFGGVIEITVKT